LRQVFQALLQISANCSAARVTTMHFHRVFSRSMPAVSPVPSAHETARGRSLVSNLAATLLAQRTASLRARQLFSFNALPRHREKHGNFQHLFAPLSTVPLADGKLSHLQPARGAFRLPCPCAFPHRSGRRTPRFRRLRARFDSDAPCPRQPANISPDMHLR